jgi:hypothetical protein
MAAASLTLALLGACTLDPHVDYFIDGQPKSCTADSAEACCKFCQGGLSPSPVLPPQTYFSYFSYTDSGDCYCKPSKGDRRKSATTTSGACGPAPPAPPPLPQAPNDQGCLAPLARAHPYCNETLSIAARVAALVGAMNLTEKVSRMYSCVDTCDTCPCPVPRLGLPAFAYLLEANTAVAAMCLDGRCATVFNGPLGLAASFNRTAWGQKGRVLGRETRAFNNHGGTRGLGPLTGLAGFGPNINVVRDPRFGRNSELPGEDPFLSGSYAVAMTRGMRETDARGHPMMVSYLKHFTAYSRETGRGHDTYEISAFDFGETYLPQYEMGMVDGQSDGVMCSCAAPAERAAAAPRLTPHSRHLYRPYSYGTGTTARTASRRAPTTGCSTRCSASGGRGPTPSS